MTQYNVTPEYVTQAAADCDRVANDVKTQLTALQTFVTGLGASWLGVSALQFAELMNNFHMHSVHLHDALVEIGQGLRSNVVNYVESEADNVRGLSSINGGLNPGVYAPMSHNPTGNVIPPANL
ncbi:WXG100 family type VII secretion target [Micromonospora sp. CA-111912]|uniref:WXG100 family type VII secretion target n=1 Tax=Micromonospora sp. CA-111912 TaxID=3239955 RepID=UPI003D92388F